MANKSIPKEASPMTWEQFQILSSRIANDIDHSALTELKKIQLSKFLILINVGCYFGLRISDILELEWCDILDNDELSIKEMKTGKVRRIMINAKLQSLLTKYRRIIQPSHFNEKVFTNIRGQVFSRQYVNKKLKELLKQYGIKVKNVSTHTLRKTFGMRVYEMNFKSDDALILLSQIFNHANTAITRRYIGLQGKKIENVYLSL